MDRYGYTVKPVSIILSSNDLDQLRGAKEDLKTELRNIDKLKDTIFDSLKLMPIYLKEIRKEPDMKIPIIVSTDTNLKELCRKIKKDFVEKFKFARIWGKSVRFPGKNLTFTNRGN